MHGQKEKQLTLQAAAKGLRKPGSGQGSCRKKVRPEKGISGGAPESWLRRRDKGFPVAGRNGAFPAEDGRMFPGRSPMRNVLPPEAGHEGAWPVRTQEMVNLPVMSVWGPGRKQPAPACAARRCPVPRHQAEFPAWGKACLALPGRGKELPGPRQTSGRRETAGSAQRLKRFRPVRGPAAAISQVRRSSSRDVEPAAQEGATSSSPAGGGNFSSGIR